MKKKEFLLGFFAMAMALVLSASFVSCGDDDDDKKTENNDGDPGNHGDDDSDDDGNGGQYLDASISWGASVATIKRYMSGYELLYEGDDELIYRGTGTANFYDYYFDGGLVFSEVDLVMDSISKQTIADKLISAGYTLVNQVDTTDYYLSSDKATATAISTSKYYGVYEVCNYDYDWLMEEDVSDTTATATWKDPYITWGASKTAVKNYMSGYEMIDEDYKFIGYEGKDDEDSYWYFFDSAKLVESDVDIPQEITTLSDLYTKLTNDGYEYLGVKPDTVFHFISADQSTYIFLVAMDYYGMNEIAYVDYSSLSSSRSMSGQTAGPAKLNYADFKREKKLATPKAAKAVKGSKASFNLKKAVLRKAMR